MPREYKIYDDLEWKEHHLATDAKRLAPREFPMLAENKDAKHAIMFFDNGYGISVIKDCPLLTMDSKFECAVLRQSPDGRYGLDYGTGIADDVIRTNYEGEISHIMHRIQDLPPVNQKAAA